MSQHRRRVPAQKVKRRRAVVVTAFAATVALGLGVGVWASTGGDGTAGPSGGRAAVSADSPSATPSPSRSYALSEAPATVPAVRTHTAARGPGWRPARDHRVVVADPKLAADGKLIAAELGMTYAGQKGDERTGDLRLALGGGSGADPESYTMTVSGGRVNISGPAAPGVFYGTRTLKQAVHGGATAPEGVVRDAPAKPVRGFMLDIARKNFTASWIEDRVRELGDLKYNELGLHFSDDQGFRIQSDTHPEIVSKEHLSKAQVRKIIALADSRHITVVPEIDSPGHLGAVIAAHPDLQLRNTRGVATRGAVDISKPAAAHIVDDLLNEFAGLFPGKQWNLGGDEYQALTVPDPAASFPQLASAAREAYGSGGTVSDLATGWLNDRADTIRAHDRTMRAWNDGFLKGTSVQPAEDLRVAYWTGKEIGARQPVEYLSTGRKLINYNDEYLYYVLGQPNTFVYPTGQRIYEQWTPLVVRGTTPVPAKYDGQILGGTFAVWCDLANSQTQDQVAAGIRMPLAATAQKLWDSGRPALSWTEFKALAGRVA
ncbi:MULTISPECIES: beta-N-acetylhexosaminidase [Streptomyces]|uniref:Glycoside hydrolase family 20 protein n=1 Tax=Streptomyces doudnae TaxID=3075536 RepID=A0ABD5EKC2_9ACTN|nr:MULTISPECIES: glycoside hydrolase family 20 protein [unclassified Streptomyces]MDT0434285.1 glycoside hydrolase family 20 protein [Streptomyces sp. DSM 41981]MYQ64791.1 family 20 glycosylhydrolase [Streptomyces sp. SID4950]